MDKRNTDESKVYGEETSWYLLCRCLWERDPVISVILDSRSDEDALKSAVLVHSRLLNCFFPPNSYKSVGPLVLFRSQVKCWSPAFPLPPLSTPFPAICMACTIIFFPHRSPARSASYAQWCGGIRLGSFKKSLPIIWAKFPWIL